jgi:glycosyltransferase involved in cell wall biosynthesis
VFRVCLVGLIAGGKSGVPRYAAALTNGLDRVAPEFSGLTLRLLTTRRGADEVRANHIAVKTVSRPFADANAGPLRIVAEQLHARSVNADLLHFFDLSGPVLARSRPFVTTVHDAAVQRGLERSRVAYKRLLQPWAIRHAVAGVAVSAFARDEAVRLLHANPAQIQVVRSGPGLIGAGSNAVSTGDEPYLLYVGNFAVHKNVSFLIRAFEAADVDRKLILAGTWGDRFGEVRRALESSPAAGRIEIRRDPSDAELNGLYRGAAMLLLPSRYEGFGFTPLEAMARGCPVLASDIPALREVSGGGALLLPVDGVNAWSDAIRRVLSDSRLSDDLRRRGSQVVSRYSWEDAARRVCRLFLRLADD